MTRNNLASHISWLLSSKATLPRPLLGTAPIHSAAVVEIAHSEPVEDQLEEIPGAPSSSTPNRRIILTADAVQDFVRPQLPSTTSLPKLQSREPRGGFVDESMGKLASASRSTRPSLLSQQQLATPASTKGSSSLMQGYESFLRADVTHSSRQFVDPHHSNLSKPLKTPQTPRQTPRQPPLPRPRFNVEQVESVDLTDFNSDESPHSRSSSTEIAFGESRVIWREDSASRAEPPPRTGKKRKSNEISTKSVEMRDRNEESQAEKSKHEERDNLEDFVDIDDIDTRPTPRRLVVDKSRARLLNPTGELSHSEDEFEEEYRTTETVTRVETLVRKSIGRVSTAEEDRPEPTGTPELQMIGSQTKTESSCTTSRPRGNIQVVASPKSKSVESPSNKPVLTPKKRQKLVQERVIHDSDDEEAVSVTGGQASCSPRRPLKDSPKIVGASKSPGWHEIPTFEPPHHSSIDFKDSRSRTGSPLRLTSRNVVSIQGVPSPFQLDSPTKVSLASKTSMSQSSQSAPSSTLSPDDEKLVGLLLTQPSAVAPYQKRVQRLIDENSVAAMQSMDEGLPAPVELIEQRKLLLDMRKAYDALTDLCNRHEETMKQKRDLARKVMELLDVGADASTQEERSALLTQDRRRIEIDIGRLLHASGAVKDGFGRGPALDDFLVPHTASSKSHDDLNQLPSRSNTTDGAQIIFQTQIPSMQSSVHGVSQPTRDSSTMEPSHGVNSGIGASPANLGHTASPYSRRWVAPSVPIVRHQPQRAHNEFHLKPPDLHGGSSPADYEFEPDVPLDDLLGDLQEIRSDESIQGLIPGEIDDQYGSFDEDDDDMLEFAEDFEQRQSFTMAKSSASHRKVLSETSGNTPEPPKRSRSTAARTMYSTVNPEQADMSRHPWSKDVKKALRERFKLQGFRHHQLDAINATLAGKDAFVLMPTGGGKSLCYQLPAVIQSGKTRGVTIVISPLLSLMTDQVEHLKKLHIQAATLNGEVPTEQRRVIMDQLSDSHPEQYIQLLYITPEMINKSQAILNVLSKLHRNKKLARIVIDEAHCVSQWGHDFRPDYVALGGLRERFPNVPFMALTATATENVKIDALHNLGMEKCAVYSQSFNRPNLHYEVRSKKGRGKSKEILDEIADLIKNEYKNQTGIIYTLSRKGCEQLATKLKNDYKIKAHHYHASMTPSEKARIQRSWQNGTLKVVVATIAFGMGIDKPDVRFVIHHTIPKSLEGYYQETGRAGRDGKKSGCYLYYGYQDTATLKHFIYESEGSEEQKERQRKMLSNMVQYCENRCDCRRVQVLAYFGESFAKEDCGHTCDNCSAEAVFETIDVTTQAVAALNIVTQVQDSQVTLLHCVDLLRGASSAKTRKMGHDTVRDYGFASDMARGEVERLFYRLLMENALEEHNVINGSGFATQYLHIGPNSRAFKNGRRKLKLQVKVSASPAARPTKAQPSRSGAGVGAQGNSMYPSTMLTSPLSAPARRHNHVAGEGADNRGYRRDDFVASDNEDDGDDYFEPVRDSRRIPNGKRSDALGPPITADKRMEVLPEIHRVAIQQFVEEAKKLGEKIRNERGLQKSLFTEANFREMAIKWTLNLEDMRQIPGINLEKVDLWGHRFLPLIQRYSSDYNKMMDRDEDRDMDRNHDIVIDLRSDDEDFGDLGSDDYDEDSVLQAEQGSKYFDSSTHNSASSSRAAPSRQLPSSTATRTKSPAAKSYASKNFARGRANFKRRGGGQKSARSTSSAGGRRSTSGQSTSGGVTKRRTSSGARKATTTTSKRPNLMAAFGRQSGSGATGGSATRGGICMMPA